jgi:hypothetical protein
MYNGILLEDTWRAHKNASNPKPESGHPRWSATGRNLPLDPQANPGKAGVSTTRFGLFLCARTRELTAGRLLSSINLNLHARRIQDCCSPCTARPVMRHDLKIIAR